MSHTGWGLGCNYKKHPMCKWYKTQKPPESDEIWAKP